MLVMPSLWLSVEHVSARLRWLILLRTHQHPFLSGLATLLDPVQSVPTTLLVSCSLANFSVAYEETQSN